jgi:RHS repeat-associated protein
LAAGNGTVLERYEYDAYGNPYVLEPNFADDPDGKTDWANPYYFTGRRADFLDGGKLTLQINRHRYYDYYTGRWLSHDPLGITANGTSLEKLAGMDRYQLALEWTGGEPSAMMEIARALSEFSMTDQYQDGLNLYETVGSNPVTEGDPYGLWGQDTHKDSTIGWAKDEEYTAKCAQVIGQACNNVDSISSHIGPWPLVGDMSYHFDTNPSGSTYAGGARYLHFAEHYEEAKTKVRHAGTWGVVQQGLSLLGKALHPLQDSFSHTGITMGHKAASPRLHAPRVYCIFIGDPSGTSEPFCIWQRTTSANWGNPHLPDDASTWVNDHNMTGAVTRSVVRSFFGAGMCVTCFCKKGYAI